MGIVGGASEAPFPINVGLLFFHAEPFRCFPATQIDVVWFPEGRGGDRFTEKGFKGPLHKILREALSYIKATFLSTTVVKRADRAEADRVANYPFEAIEEALVNAVYHRGYGTREPIEVTFTRDEFTVVSYPGPDRSVKTKELAEGRAISRRYRNRRIGEFLKELDLTEGRGTGIPKILRAMRENGSPLPEFRTDEDHTFFATVLPIHPEARATASDLHGDLHGDLYGPETRQVAEHVLRVVEHLDGEVTRQGLQEALGLGNRDHFRKAYLLPALEAGLVEMTLPDKPNSRSQRYRLTAAGRKLRAPRAKRGSAEVPRNSTSNRGQRPSNSTSNRRQRPSNSTSNRRQRPSEERQVQGGRRSRATCGTRACPRGVDGEARRRARRNSRVGVGATPLGR